MKFWPSVAVVAATLCFLWVFLTAPNFPHRELGIFGEHDYAHRGLWNAQRPENSLPAFAAALEAGCGIETDIHLTKDGQLVLFHDDSLERMCGVDRRITDCTLAELKELTLAGSAERIPTLDELLALADGRVPLLLEHKSSDRIEELSAAVYARMQSYAGPWCMESFDPRAVRWYKRNAPEVRRGQLAFGLRGANYSKTKPLNILLASMLQNVMGRPDFVAFDVRTEASASFRLMRRVWHPATAAWTVRSQEQMDALRGRYRMQIFEGFEPSPR